MTSCDLFKTNSSLSITNNSSSIIEIIELSERFSNYLPCDFGEIQPNTSKKIIVDEEYPGEQGVLILNVEGNQYILETGWIESVNEVKIVVVDNLEYYLDHSGFTGNGNQKLVLIN